MALWRIFRCVVVHFHKTDSQPFLKLTILHLMCAIRIYGRSLFGWAYVWAKFKAFTLSLSLFLLLSHCFVLVQFKLPLVQFDIVRTRSKCERYRNGAHQTPWVIFHTVDGTIVMNNKINSCALECLRKPTTECRTIFGISCTLENVRLRVYVRQTGNKW